MDKSTKVKPYLIISYIGIVLLNAWEIGELIFTEITSSAAGFLPFMLVYKMGWLALIAAITAIMALSYTRNQQLRELAICALVEIAILFTFVPFLYYSYPYFSVVIIIAQILPPAAIFLSYLRRQKGQH